MPKEHNKILTYKHGEKSTKVPLIVYAHMESLLKKKTSTSYNNRKKSWKTKISKHKPSG